MGKTHVPELNAKIVRQPTHNKMDLWTPGGPSVSLQTGSSKQQITGPGLSHRNSACFLGIFLEEHEASGFGENSGWGSKGETPSITATIKKLPSSGASNKRKDLEAGKPKGLCIPGMQ